MNCSLLDDEEYEEDIARMIPLWTAERQKEFTDNRMIWDWIKYKIRTHAIQYSKRKAKERGKRELDLQEELSKAKSNFENNPNDDNTTYYNLGCVQTDATTPNIIAPTMLGVVACVSAVVCKRMQQLPKSLGPAVHRGKNTTHKSFCNPCVMSVRGPNNVGRAVQTDPILLRYASAITEQKKCWQLLAEKFDRFQTLICATTRNNIQQHETGCANRRNM